MFTAQLVVNRKVRRMKQIKIKIGIIIISILLVCSLIGNIYLLINQQEMGQSSNYNDYFLHYNPYAEIRLGEYEMTQKTLKIPFKSNCEANTIFISKYCLNFTKDKSIIMSWEWQ